MNIVLVIFGRGPFAPVSDKYRIMFEDIRSKVVPVRVLLPILPLRIRIWRPSCKIERETNTQHYYSDSTQLGKSARRCPVVAAVRMSWLTGG